MVVPLCRLPGATHCVDYRGDVASAVRSLTPDGVDFIVDCIGGESPTSLLPGACQCMRVGCVASKPRFSK